MRILFFDEPEGGVSAVAQDVVYEGYLHQELYYADLNKLLGGWVVRWQDDYNTPYSFESLGDAKAHVLVNYSIHKPHSNGNKFEIGE